MNMLSSTPPVPVHAFKRDEASGNNWFTITRSEGGLTYEADLLLPHRKDYYLMVFVRRNQGRHWADGKAYEHPDNSFYFSGPAQMLVKEEATPFWGTHFAFTSEFLALQPSADLRSLPLIQNPHQGHELRLTEADALVVEDLLARLEAEQARPGEWQHRLLTAYLTALLTYLSRLYKEQFTGAEPSAEQRLLHAYQARVEEHFRELHEVGDYAAQLHLSAGHLSEVVKAQSGKPAIKHLHDRLVLEARRLLFYTRQPLKEIAFDLGFSDASYFNRFFKRETGSTPAQYRSNTRKMYQ
ncbi:AraC family transcriptional regulator [Hymenobacter sp. ASUV-10]|uniref:AraC family transcriptional regulator n=1 Tax=Hymenobacter aranciens TaxID=3063996 RepID=A0ABT9BD29_9BACT|nr:AraC family transcriptional regulator [Hymenobacter sp. ASUV-10]MDO7876157.1 AraC family transcriptional regulator [Hymenobacter sp. ASUV-10]